MPLMVLGSDAADRVAQHTAFVDAATATRGPGRRPHGAGGEQVLRRDRGPLQGAITVAVAGDGHRIHDASCRLHRIPMVVQGGVPMSRPVSEMVAHDRSADYQPAGGTSD